jgi:hypothetical protein
VLWTRFPPGLHSTLAQNTLRLPTLQQGVSESSLPPQNFSHAKIHFGVYLICAAHQACGFKIKLLKFTCTLLSLAMFRNGNSQRSSAFLAMVLQDRETGAWLSACFGRWKALTAGFPALVISKGTCRSTRKHQQ